MDAFARFSSSLLLVAASLGAGCVDELEPIEGTSSLRVELLEPAETGSVDDRLGDDQRSAVVQVSALDTTGAVDTGFAGEVQLYAHYLGSLSPRLSETPLATAELSEGRSAPVALELPQVFGPSFLWVEDGRGDAPTFATGTTPILWFRDPYLADVSRPRDEAALDAFERSPLETKQINVSRSRYGERGRLVVTGVYAQGYTVSDVECQDAAGTPPCRADAYDHIFVFTFSRPEDESGRRIARGHVVDRLTGSVSEFNGLTEVNFPQTFISDTEPHLDLVPEPVVVEPSWLSTRIELERLEAGLVAIDGATVCPLDEEFATYSQWKLDIGLGCGRPVNVISKGELAEFDPADHEGEVLGRVVGTLRPVNIGSFHVWIIYPRDDGDVAL